MKTYRLKLYLLILATVFFLTALIFNLSKNYQKNAAEKGVVTRAGQVSKLNESNQLLTINLGDDQEISLNYDDQSQMISSGESQAVNFASKKIKVGDQVLLRYNAENNHLQLLWQIDYQNALLPTIKGKIGEITDNLLTVQTIEENSRSQSFSFNKSSLKVVDKTATKDQIIDFDNLKNNDDIIVEYNNNNEVVNIYLIKIGPS